MTPLNTSKSVTGGEQIDIFLHDAFSRPILAEESFSESRIALNFVEFASWTSRAGVHCNSSKKAMFRTGFAGDIVEDVGVSSMLIIFSLEQADVVYLNIVVLPEYELSQVISALWLS